MKLIDFLGMSAATLTTGCFVPQVVRLWRTRNAEGISLVTFSAFSVGVALWLAYGVIMEAWPIILSNAITLVLAIAIIVLTLRFRRRG
ncbi:MAG TPA: SemiSWEET transporter [Opitutaceae bacterium]|nr:SemiSWEET transporter [Opitutaceae bacterium]